MKNITQSSKVIVLALVLSFGLSYVYAWTAPTVSAPGGNVSAPINTSTATQVKDGTLGITGLIRGYTGALLTGTTATNPVAGACPAGYYWVDGNGNGTIENGECKIISLYAKSDGNVGVGTTSPSPQTKLHVGNGTLAGALTPNILSASTGSAYVAASDGTRTTFLGADNGSSEGMVGTFTNHKLALRTNNVDQVLIDTTGNVGIGTTAPNAKLDVAMGNDNIAFYQPTDNVMGIQAYIDGQWANRSTYAGGCCNSLVLQPTAGNVGIGTTAPNAKLDVAGSIRPGSATASGACSTIGAQAYNSATGAPLYCNGTVWKAVGATASSVWDDFVGRRTTAQNIYGWIANVTDYYELVTATTLEVHQVTNGVDTLLYTACDTTKTQNTANSPLVSTGMTGTLSCHVLYRGTWFNWQLTPVGIREYGNNTYYFWPWE